MNKKAIVFTKPYTAEYIDEELRDISDDEVLVKMEYTAVSGGTERACIVGSKNTNGDFPRRLGYCGVGYIEELGSYPHHWTHHDDCRAILDLISARKIKVKPIISRVVLPEEAPKIYEELCYDKNFPLGTIFDWRSI